MKENIGIIGAGVGGLATAARLAHKGYDVEIFEKLPECGGRAHIIEDKGFKFDTGPSFILMPDFFAEVFSYCGKNINDYLKFKTLDISYKIFYPDGDILTIHRDSNKTKEELKKFEKSASSAFDGFIKASGDIYKNVKPLLYKNFRPVDALNPGYWPLINKIEILKTYWGLAKKFFRSDKLCYAFTFEAMFIGVSPFSAPAFYSVISYVDHAQKIAHPMGGMYMVPKALEKLCIEKGVKINYSSEVSSIRKKKKKFDLVTDKKVHQFDKVVANADYAHTINDLEGRPLPDFRYSCSVYLIYLGISKKLKGLEHHNLFFAKDLRNNLTEIFDKKVVPQDPSYYIHVPTVTDPSLAPEGKEILYILIPVPNLQGYKGDFKDHDERLRRLVLDKVKEITGEDIESLIEVEHRFYPEDFIKRYNIKYGATFGLAHNLMQSAFFRPSNADRRIKGLYYAGASVQPGGGLPPVIASSRIVSDLIAGR